MAYIFGMIILSITDDDSAMNIVYATVMGMWYIGVIITFFFYLPVVYDGVF